MKNKEDLIVDKGFSIFLFAARTDAKKCFSQEEAYHLKLSISDEIAAVFESIFITSDISGDVPEINWLTEDTLFDLVSGECYIYCATSTDEEVIKTKQIVKDTIAGIIRKHVNINSHGCIYLDRADNINHCISIIDSAIGELLDIKGTYK